MRITASLKKILSPALRLSLVLHFGVFFLLTGFNLWPHRDKPQELIIEATLVPDVLAPQQARARTPVPPPPPPPPPQTAPQPTPIATRNAAEPPPKPLETPPEPPQPAIRTPEPLENTAEFSQSILKTLETYEPPTADGTAAQNTAPELPERRDNSHTQTADAKRSALTVAEIQTLRNALAQCWSLPAGGRDMAGLNVRVRIEINPDRSVRSAELVNDARMSDPFFRSAAESALRAFYHPKCAELPLPEDKYNVWKLIIFSFDPSEMLG